MAVRILARYHGQPPRFVAEDKCAALPGMAPPECYEPFDVEALNAHYDGLNLDTADTGLDEKVATIVSSPTNLSDPEKPIVIRWLTMMDVHAVRQGKFEGAKPLNIGVVCNLVTEDGLLVIGQRGGDLEPLKIATAGRGLYGLPPGGHASWPNVLADKTLEGTVMSELHEELGPWPISAMQALGVVEVTGKLLPGIKFVMLLHTSATFAEIKEHHDKAMTIYWEIRHKRGTEHGDGVRAVKDAGFPPDSWEHGYLVSVDNSRTKLEAMLELPQFFNPTAQGQLALQRETL